MTKMKEGDEDLARVRQLAQEIGIGWDDFLKEKVLELQERRRAAAIPNVTWYRDHPHDLDSFLDLMHFPQTDEVRETFKEYLKGFLKGGHRTTLDKAAEEELLKRQNQRCRSCGKRLTRDPRDYEVDHIVPFSAQDRDRLEN
ncbi:MAG: hypothetical protein KAW09_04920, partial [Thermoplasmata archaeon]|nr:hypothetical protein [Thermoplasmata archaeon]